VQHSLCDVAEVVFLQSRVKLLKISHKCCGRVVSECLALLLSQTVVCTCVSVYKTTADYIPVDLSKESGIVAYVQELSKLYPHGVDILVNNAGKSENVAQ